MQKLNMGNKNFVVLRQQNFTVNLYDIQYYNPSYPQICQTPKHQKCNTPQQFYQMDYNQFTYYRANPYSNQGYMPPTAFINRHKPNFITELPMGEQHLGKIGRKQYSDNAHHKSHIDAENILKSPQRYPYQNRIAFDKNYQRNLNTIDIQGASGGTLVSQAVRNKMKAREELIRRQESEKMSSNHNEILNMAEVNEQQKRRKLAYTQYLRDQQMKQINESKQKQSKNSIGNSSYIQNNTINNDSRIQQKNIMPEYLNNVNNRNHQLRQSPLLKPRYQSIDLGRQRDNSYQQYQPENYHRYQRQRNTIQNSLLDKSVEISSRNVTKDTESESGTDRNRETPYLAMPKDRKQLRQQNPTNLSSQGSLNLAARNIIKNQ